SIAPAIRPVRLCLDFPHLGYSLSSAHQRLCISINRQAVSNLWGQSRISLDLASFDLLPCILRYARCSCCMVFSDFNREVPSSISGGDCPASSICCRWSFQTVGFLVQLLSYLGPRTQRS